MKQIKRLKYLLPLCLILISPVLAMNQGQGYKVPPYMAGYVYPEHQKPRDRHMAPSSWYDTFRGGMQYFSTPAAIKQEGKPHT